MNIANALGTQAREFRELARERGVTRYSACLSTAAERALCEQFFGPEEEDEDEHTTHIVFQDVEMKVVEGNTIFWMFRMER